jgi:hypothetical protein
MYSIVLGGTTGLNRNPHAVNRVRLSSYALPYNSTTLSSSFPKVSSKGRPSTVSEVFPDDKLKLNHRIACGYRIALGIPASSQPSYRFFHGSMGVRVDFDCG